MLDKNFLPLIIRGDYWEGLIWFSYECVFLKPAGCLTGWCAAASSHWFWQTVPIYFQFWSFDISHSGSIYIMEISNLYKPGSPPLFFLLESWLLNIYPCISVILNHRYLVIWQHKRYWVFPDWASFPRDMILCHYIRIMKNDTRGYSVQNVPDYWPTVSTKGVAETWRTPINSLHYPQEEPGIMILLRILNRTRGKGGRREDTFIERTH